MDLFFKKSFGNPITFFEMTMCGLMYLIELTMCVGALTAGIGTLKSGTMSCEDPPETADDNPESES